MGYVNFEEVLNCLQDKLESYMSTIKSGSGNRMTVNLLGVNIDAIDTKGLCRKIVDFTDQGSTRTVMYVNTDCMLISRENAEYRQALNEASLVYADGVGVVYGVKLWGDTLPGRSTGADFMPDFCRIFAKNGIRLYFLGAADGVAEEAADSLRRDIPDLYIVGSHHGYFPSEQNDAIIAEINAAKPDIVVVGFGAPSQELWMKDNADKLDAAVLWGVGGLFDFLSGRTKRGPQWLLDHGFEWLCRLCVEPRRLWRRYLVGNTKFVLYLLRQRFLGHISG